MTKEGKRLQYYLRICLISFSCLFISSMESSIYSEECFYLHFRLFKRNSTKYPKNKKNTQKIKVYHVKIICQKARQILGLYRKNSKILPGKFISNDFFVNFKIEKFQRIALHFSLYHNGIAKLVDLRF